MTGRDLAVPGPSWNHHLGEATVSQLMDYIEVRIMGSTL